MSHSFLEEDQDIKSHAKNEGMRGADRAVDMNFEKSDGIWTVKQRGEMRVREAIKQRFRPAGGY